MGKSKSNIIQNGTTSKSFDVKIHYDEASEPYAVTLGENTYYYIRNAVGDVKGVINADTGEYVYALNTSAYGVLNFIEPDLTFDTSSLIPNPTEAIPAQGTELCVRLKIKIPWGNHSPWLNQIKYHTNRKHPVGCFFLSIRTYYIYNYPKHEVYSNILNIILNFCRFF